MDPTGTASNGNASPSMGGARPTDALASLVGRPVVRAVLGIPLFWKIFLANVFLLAVGTAAGVALTVRSGRMDLGEVTVVGVAAATILIVCSIAINAALVRLALSPVDALAKTAEDVRRGETTARASASPVADPGLRHLEEAFNQMLDTLSASRNRQQELARRVLQAEERERQRIAHELYSGTAQTLAGVLVRLRIAERHLSSGANGSIDEIREEVANALEEIRGVARRLRPPELDELGVRVALEAHVRSMIGTRGVNVAFEGEVPTLPRESNLALFRIVQEAISNAILHSGADNLKVRFSAHEGGVLAEVEDDGRGFDLAAALAHTGESLGLFGMHERAGYVQGELSLKSGPGRGTVVRVTIPGASMPGLVDTPQEAFGGTADRLVEGLVEDESGLATAAAGEAGTGSTRL